MTSSKNNVDKNYDEKIRRKLCRQKSTKASKRPHSTCLSLMQDRMVISKYFGC